MGLVIFTAAYYPITSSRRSSLRTILSAHLSSVSVSVLLSPEREGIQINMNAELRTILSAHLSSVSLRCSRLDTDDTQIHVNGFLRAHFLRGEERFGAFL